MDPKRIPKESDSADLYHCVQGLSHCDFLVSNDAWMMAGAGKVKAKMAESQVKTATLFSSLEQLSEAIGASK